MAAQNDMRRNSQSNKLLILVSIIIIIVLGQLIRYKNPLESLKYDGVVRMVAADVVGPRELELLLLLLLLLILLLLLCGGIHPNPGPVKHPCSVCEKPVGKNQRALLCDGCGLWAHCRCCGVLKNTYLVYQSLDEFSWSCPRCLAKELPFWDCSTLATSCTPSVLSHSFSSCQSSDAESFMLPVNRHSSGILNAHINTRSILPCVDEVHHLLLRGRVDVLLI